MKKLEQLEIIDTLVGQGVDEVQKGDVVVMHYTGRLIENGKEFDSSYTRNKLFQTVIGVGQVIRGWDEGVPGMKVGGKRTLNIPSSMGYGEKGAGDSIPPNADLTFDVELVLAYRPLK